MNNKLLVQEAHVRPGPWGVHRHTEVAPTLVCPLCAMDGSHRPDERTATYAPSGHILCLPTCGGCGRYSAILMRTPQIEVPLIPVAFLRDARFLETQSAAIARLRPALMGAGDLLELVAMDDVQPHVNVGFVLPKILVTGELHIETEPASPVQDFDFDSIGRRGRMPASVERLLRTGQLEFAAG
jgi:hypothetical protein